MSRFLPNVCSSATPTPFGIAKFRNKFNKRVDVCFSSATATPRRETVFVQRTFCCLVQLFVNECYRVNHERWCCWHHSSLTPLRSIRYSDSGNPYRALRFFIALRAFDRDVYVRIGFHCGVWGDSSSSFVPATPRNSSVKRIIRHLAESATTPPVRE